MKRRVVDQKLIDHRDANSKEFVWFTGQDGVRRLYGLKRLVSEHSISISTFYLRWEKAGQPDEIPASMLAPARNSHNGKAEKIKKPAVQEIEAPKPEPVKKANLGSSNPCFLLLPEGTYHTGAELSRMFDVPQSTLACRKRAGRTTFTREELQEWSRTEKKERWKRGTSNAADDKQARPMNIHDVVYKPSRMESALLGLR